MMNLNLSIHKNEKGSLSPMFIDKIRNINNASVFIETGTYLGDTAQNMSLIFDKVISIELSSQLFLDAQLRLRNNKKIFLLQGDSASKLRDACSMASGKPSIVWLDAHWSGGNTARSSENTPVLAELKSLIMSGVEGSIIIIDDIRYFIDLPSGFEVHEANSGYPKLKEIIDFVTSRWSGYECILNGDMLFIIPSNLMQKIHLSDVLVATNNLRLGFGDDSEIVANEQIVASAVDHERECILKLPEVYSHSLQYGIGGEYLYWRGLVLENDGERDRAAQDFQLARKCGIRIPSRAWE